MSSIEKNKELTKRQESVKSMEQQEIGLQNKMCCNDLVNFITLLY